MVRKILTVVTSFILITNGFTTKIFAENWTLNGSDIYNNNSGNVGIGTASPSYKLDILGSGTVQQRLQSSLAGSDVGFLLTTSGVTWSNYMAGTDQSLRFKVYGSDVVTFKDSGNVGIGTTTPNKKLVVSGDGIAINSGSNLYLNGDSDSNWYFGKDANHNILVNGASAGARSFQIRDTVSSNAVRFNVNLGTGSSYFDGGNLGVGTTTPAAKLDVSNTYTSATAGEQFTERIRSFYQAADTSLKQGLRLDTNATHTTGTIDNLFGIVSLTANQSSGNVASAIGLWSRIDNTGTGTITNGFGLRVFNSAGSGPLTSQYGVFIDELTRGTSNNYAIFTSGATKSSFGGNVGIGTTAPAEKLDVNGVVRLAQTTAPATVTDKLYNVAGTLYWNGSALGGGGGGSTSWSSLTNPTANLTLEMGAHTTTFNTAGNNAFTIAGGTGKVGIGNATPTARLSVGSTAVNHSSLNNYQFGTDCPKTATWLCRAGTLAQSNEADQPFGFYVSVFGSATESDRVAILQTGTEGANNSGKLALQPYAGNVGVGTLTPSYTLDVQGGAGIVGQFSGRVKGASAVNPDEFATLSQVTGGGTNYWAPSGVGNIYAQISGNVGIGIVLPRNKLHLSGGTVPGQVDYPLKVQSGAGIGLGNAPGILFSPSSVDWSGKGALVYRDDGAGWDRGDFHFLQNSSQDASTAYYDNSVMVIKNDGRVGIGTKSPNALLQLSAAGDTDIGKHNLIQEYASNNAALKPTWFAQRSRGTLSSKLAVADGDGIGLTEYSAWSGSSYKTAARIGVDVDGLVSADSVPGSIYFSTTSAGDLNPTKRMVIDYGGWIGMGTTSPISDLELQDSNPTFTLSGSPISGAGSIAMVDFRAISSGQVKARIEAVKDVTESRGSMIFSTADVSGILTEVMKINQGSGVSIVGGGGLEVRSDTGLSTPLTISGNSISGAGPIGQLDFKALSTGQVKARIEAVKDVTESRGSMIFSTADMGGTMTEVMRIDQGSSVGIGTTNPLGRLDVSDNTDANLVISSNSPGGPGPIGKINFRALSASSDNARIEAIKQSGNNDGALIFSTSDTTGIMLESMRIKNGNVGLGTLDPMDRLHLGTGRIRVGTWIADGTVAVYKNSSGQIGLKPSDSRLKKNITPIEDSLSKIKEINGVTFNWPSDPDNATKSAGVIAQDVMKVFPEVIYTFKDEKGEDYYGVKYDELSALLIQAIKDQQGIIEKQGEKITDLITRLERVEKQLAQ